MWFDPGLAGLFITSTLLHLGEDIILLVVSVRDIFIRELNVCETREGGLMRYFGVNKTLDVLHEHFY